MILNADSREVECRLGGERLAPAWRLVLHTGDEEREGQVVKAGQTIRLEGRVLALFVNEGGAGSGSPPSA